MCKRLEMFFLVCESKTNLCACTVMRAGGNVSVIVQRCDSICT